MIELDTETCDCEKSNNVVTITVIIIRCVSPNRLQCIGQVQVDKPSPHKVASCGEGLHNRIRCRFRRS